jgi:hypothetical protein
LWLLKSNARQLPSAFCLLINSVTLFIISKKRLDEIEGCGRDNAFNIGSILICCPFFSHTKGGGWESDTRIKKKKKKKNFVSSADFGSLSPSILYFLILLYRRKIFFLSVPLLGVYKHRPRRLYTRESSGIIQLLTQSSPPTNSGFFFTWTLPVVK